MTSLISTGPFTLTPTQQSAGHPKSKYRRWGKKEMLKYGIFLHYFSSRGLLPYFVGNKWSFFRSLSIFLQNKNPNQCRIHHLDMLQRHNTIQSILHFFLTENQNFLIFCQKFEPSIKNIIHIIAKEQASNSRTSTTAKPASRSLDPARQKEQMLEYGKQKDELKPTDIDYPQESNAMLFKEDQSTNRKRFEYPMQDQKETMLNQKTVDCQLRFMEYLGKLSALARSHHYF